MKTTLRNFLFLNTALLTDYLSTLEGHVVEGTIDQTESGKKEKGGKVGYKIVEGSAASETSTETKQRLAVTDAAKFQGLYELLEEQEVIQYLEAFDESIWNQLQRNEVLEVQAVIRVPEMFVMGTLADDTSSLMNFMSRFGLDSLIDSGTRTAVEGIREFTKLSADKPIPLLFEAVSAPKFQFVANLPRQYLRCGPANLEGEATVFGKILRVLPKRTTLEVFNFLPEFSKFQSSPKRNLTREEQRKRKLSENRLKEIVRGPAIILDTLAVYR